MDINKNSLVKNAIFIFLNDGFNVAGSIIFIILAARVWGIEKFGEFSYAIALASMFSIIADFGLSRFITMLTAREDNHSEVFWEGLISRLILVLSFLIIALITFIFISVSREIFIAGTILVFSEGVRAFALHYQSFFRGLEKMDWDFRANAWEGSTQAVLGIILLLLGFGIIAVSFSYLVSRILKLILNIWISNRFVKLRLTRIRLAKSFEYIKRSIPYGLNVFLDRAFSQGPAILLMWFSGVRAVGVFQAAFKITNSLTLIKNPLAGTLYPRLSSTVFKSIKHSKEIFHDYSRYSIVIGLITTFPFIFFPDQVIELLYGHQYTASSIVLFFLSIGVLIRFTATVPMSLLSAKENQWYVAMSTLISALIFLPIAIVLSRLYHAKGMAIAWLVGSVFLFLLLFALSHREGYSFPLIKNIIKVTPIIIFLYFVVAIFDYFQVALHSSFICLITGSFLGLLAILCTSLMVGFIKPFEIKRIASELIKR